MEQNVSTSRVGKQPIQLPKGVECNISADKVDIKGAKGQLSFDLPTGVEVTLDDGHVHVRGIDGVDNARALSGTVRSILNNHVTGVSDGFIKKLALVGVGYRAKAAKAGNTYKLDLTLGLSHPVVYEAPEAITIETPSNTEIVVSGIDKQLVGQVAADIRGICGGVRKPEPYKGKGIRYADERVIMKEAKKK